MKKKISLMIVTLIVFLSFNSKAFAVCNDKELNDSASALNVRTMEDFIVTDENDNIIREKEYLYLLYFNKVLDNMEGMYKIEVTDSESDKKYEAKYDKTIKTYYIGSLIHYTSKKYFITVYGGEKSKCPGERIKNIVYTVPPYNDYRDSLYCEEHLQEDICAFDYDSSKINEDKYQEIIDQKEKDRELDNMTFFQKTFYYIKSYWCFVVIPVVVISLFYLVVIFIYKKRGSKE